MKVFTENEVVPAATFEMSLLASELTSDALLKLSTILSLSAMTKSSIGDVNKVPGVPDSFTDSTLQQRLQWQSRAEQSRALFQLHNSQVNAEVIS